MHIACKQCKHCKHTSPRCLIDPKDLWLDRQLHYLESLLLPKNHPSTLFQSTLYPAWPLVRWGNARSVSFWAFASSHGSKNRRPLSHLSWRNAVFTSRSQNGQVSGGRTYPPGLFPTGGITFLLFAQATTTSTQPTTTTTTTTTTTATTFAQG